jgi:putative ABC transport system permease protein
LLSLIGLFAVSYQKTSFRTKEIGIRKINGANVTEILLLITGNFAGWILIAFLIAVPSSWYAMDKWLEGYVYRADIKWWIFAVSGLMVLAVSFLTIIVQSLKAARKNPVESLKYE